MEFEDGEVSKGAAKRSWKPFYTAPTILASLIRRRSSSDVKRVPRLQEKSCPPPSCLPLHEEISISCVCISFSVSVKRGIWQPINLDGDRGFSRLNPGFQDSLGSKLVTNFS